MYKTENTCEVRTRIPESIYKEFTAFAEDSGLSVNEATAQLIINYVEKWIALNLEDFEDDLEDFEEPEKEPVKPSEQEEVEEPEEE